MKLFKKVWNSTTITTWASYSVQALNIVVVLPLVLKKFSAENIVLWYLFSTILTLLSIADFGFRTTFSRNISYAFGGAKELKTFVFSNENDSSTELSPNLSLLHGVVSTMKYTYVWLTLILAVLLGTFGTWSMMKPIGLTNNINEAWWCWVIVAVGSCIRFYGKTYMNFLEGLFKIATVRRVEALTSLGSIVSGILVLLYKPSLINLVAVTQFWFLIVVFRDWYLCHRVNDGIYYSVSKKLPFDKQMFLTIWKPAWKSGIASFMSIGLTNLTSIVYAQSSSSSSVASYLMAFRLIDQLKIVSMAPLYSKIPLLAQLRVQNNQPKLLNIAIRGVSLSHLTFMLGFVFIGMFSTELLHIIHSNVPFVSQSMWMLLGFAFFVQRYGAMHIQIYLSTNHVISHIADGVSGLLYIISALLLKEYIGVYAIPAGMIIGYLGFYSWFAARYSYRSLNAKFWYFEKKTTLLALLIFIFYIAFSLFK
ncbi:hypothetical protein [Parafilimonas sp.]|uniref:hypothetical protein n=1 Tax=Parafilimonas sp. TaxID=1969739 RepID=UPI0039E23E4A